MVVFDVDENSEGRKEMRWKRFLSVLS